MVHTTGVLRIYGTQTSPYVRRVRIVAHELKLAHELIDTSTEDGLEALRKVTPIWKIPVAEIDGVPVFDSAVINEMLLRLHGPGPLAPHDPHDVILRNAITVIDGALDSLINGFYLGKDGVTAETAAYMQKQQDRAASAMRWLEGRASEGWLTPTKSFGLAEIALCTALGWMRFRDTYAIERHPALLRCFEQHSERKSLQATQPPG
ncbi:MAG TPA: glutathione S-transferase family protein [Enhygromyxa sp.]|nr:glutathione S-transferase family protein [Enhygromyxa sp.]